MQFSRTPAKVAVIGAGMWGNNLIRNFSELNALAAVCDPDPVKLQKIVDTYVLEKTVLDYGEILSCEEIDAVVLATPAEFHGEQARQALLAGKDVFVEKPLALSQKEGRELVRIADEMSRILQVGHLLWYHPGVVRLKELVQRGELGRLRYIYSNRLNLGRLRREENVLWSFAPHDISVILGLIEEMPVSITAQGGNFLHQQIADTTVSLLTFASGIQAHIFVSWLHPFKDQKLIVVGDGKMAVFNDTAEWSEKLAIYPHAIEWNGNIPTANRAQAIFEKLEPREPLKTECEHFLECLTTRRQPLTNGIEGVRVLEVLNACQKAIETQERVLVQENQQTKIEKKHFVHHTAVLDEDVKVGDGTRIWHFSHLLWGCSIGENCTIGQNVVIGKNVVIGDHCKVQNNVSVYEGVVLDDYVFCGPSMVFTNVTNPRCEFPRRQEFKTTRVGRGATLGANSTIVCGVVIGKYAFIGAGAVVTKDVPDFALVVGNPARQIGWMSRFGERLELPVTGQGEAVCNRTQERYVLDRNVVKIYK